MGIQAIDNLTRGAAGRGLFRALALFSAPEAATLARQLKAESKKRGRKKHRRKQSAEACPPVVDRCAPQAGKCTTIFTGLCGGDPVCLARANCCSLLSTCDATGFFACLA